MSLPAAQGAKRLPPSAGHDAEVAQSEDSLVAQSEDSLLRRVAIGDDEAFAALYDNLDGVAYRLACRVVTDSALADEVMTQEAFLDVWLKAATFDPSRQRSRLDSGDHPPPRR